MGKQASLWVKKRLYGSAKSGVYTGDLIEKGEVWGGGQDFGGFFCDFLRFFLRFFFDFCNYFRKPCCGPMSSTSADPEDPPPDEVREVREVNEDEGSEDQVAK